MTYKVKRKLVELPMAVGGSLLVQAREVVVLYTGKDENQTVLGTATGGWFTIALPYDAVVREITAQEDEEEV